MARTRLKKVSNSYVTQRIIVNRQLLSYLSSLLSGNLCNKEFKKYVPMNLQKKKRSFSYL